MGRRNIYLPEPWNERVEDAAGRRGLSVSALIRLALSSYLEAEELDEPDEELLEALEEAGREIMEDRHQEGGLAPEDLDPESEIAHQGEVDLLEEVAREHGADGMPPAGDQKAPAWQAVRRGMRAYVTHVTSE